MGTCQPDMSDKGIDYFLPNSPMGDNAGTPRYVCNQRPQRFVGPERCFNIAQACLCRSLFTECITPKVHLTQAISQNCDLCKANCCLCILLSSQCIRGLQM